MSWGIFTDRNHKPGMDEALQAVATCRPLFDRLVRFVEDNFHILGEFKFYGRNYGWAIRYTKSGKSLAALYPGEGGFTVQVILDRYQADKAINSAITKPTKDIIANTPEIHEGRWIFIPIDKTETLEDMEQLILIRAKKRART